MNEYCEHAADKIQQLLDRVEEKEAENEKVLGRVERLRGYNKDLKTRVEELEKLEKYNYDSLLDLLRDDGKHIFTDEQIDTAVGACFDLADEYAVRNNEGEFDEAWERFFAALGTIECKCSQHNMTANREGCPDCNGHGWVIGGEDE